MGCNCHATLAIRQDSDASIVYQSTASRYSLHLLPSIPSPSACNSHSAYLACTRVTLTKPFISAHTSVPLPSSLSSPPMGESIPVISGLKERRVLGVGAEGGRCVGVLLDEEEEEEDEGWTREKRRG